MILNNVPGKSQVPKSSQIIHKALFCQSLSSLPSHHPKFVCKLSMSWKKRDSRNCSDLCSSNSWNKPVWILWIKAGSIPWRCFCNKEGFLGQNLQLFSLLSLVFLQFCPEIHPRDDFPRIQKIFHNSLIIPNVSLSVPINPISTD